jgi:hypothetical protein
MTAPVAECIAALPDNKLSCFVMTDTTYMNKYCSYCIIQRICSSVVLFFVDDLRKRCRTNDTKDPPLVAAVACFAILISFGRLQCTLTSSPLTLP